MRAYWGGRGKDPAKDTYKWTYNFFWSWADQAPAALWARGMMGPASDKQEDRRHVPEHAEGIDRHGIWMPLMREDGL